MSLRLGYATLRSALVYAKCTRTWLRFYIFLHFFTFLRKNQDSFPGTKANNDECGVQRFEKVVLRHCRRFSTFGSGFFTPVGFRMTSRFLRPGDGLAKTAHPRGTEEEHKQIPPPTPPPKSLGGGEATVCFAQEMGSQ